jgi:hypothetical protein
MSLKDLFDIKPLTISDITLIITGIIVFIYTKATKHSNELQISPSIVLKFKDTTIDRSLSRDGIITAKNIGKGPAYNINFLPFKLKEGDKFYTYTFYIENRTLESGEETILKKWVSTPDGGVESSGISRFLFRSIPQTFYQNEHINIYSKNPTLFVINYNGINNKKYHSVYRLYSVLPPVGDIVMQLLHQGNGGIKSWCARIYQLIKNPIQHEGTPVSDKDSIFIKIISYINKIKLYTINHLSFRRGMKILKEKIKNK